MGSVYMPTDDNERREAITQVKPLITRGMIVEADHNMFSDPEIDTEGDSGAYDPAHGAEWFNFLRQKGLLDVEREEMGRGARL